MLVSFATTGEKNVAAVMSPKNKTVSSCHLYSDVDLYIFISMWFMIGISKSSVSTVFAVSFF